MTHCLCWLCLHLLLLPSCRSRLAWSWAWCELTSWQRVSALLSGEVLHHGTFAKAQLRRHTAAPTRLWAWLSTWPNSQAGGQTNDKTSNWLEPSEPKWLQAHTPHRPARHACSGAVHWELELRLLIVKLIMYYATQWVLHHVLSKERLIKESRLLKRTQGYSRG